MTSNINTPDVSKTRGTFVMDVLENRCMCPGHFLLRLRGEAFPRTQPGQFVQLQCRPVKEQTSQHVIDWAEGTRLELTQPELTGAEAMLRRPLSLAGRHDTDEGVILEIIYRVAGMGTTWLTGLTQGEQLSVLGPLGNAFVIREDKPRAAMVGGGVGIPPMIYLASAFSSLGKDAVAFNGVRTAELLPLTIVPTAKVSSEGVPTSCVTEFARFGVSAAIATDDGTLGYSGLVSEPLTRWLDGLDDASNEAVVYTCGPEPMMRAVAELCIARDVECQVSLERHMACGMGTCQSCVCKTKNNSEQGWAYKLCCTDGPVFDANDVIWD